MTKLEQLIKELCPDGVEYVLFHDVCQYIRGITYNKQQEVKTENSDTWKVLRANNITLSTNTLNFDDVKSVDKNVKVKENQILKKNDILICAGSGSKEHIGKVAFINEDIDYTLGGFMAVIRCNSNLNSRFLFHHVSSSSFKIYLETALNSSTINNLNAGIMSNFKIPIPPLEVQREIVRILDNFTELTQELTQELTLRKKQYSYYRDKLLTFGDDVQWKTLGEIFDIRNGYTPSKSKAEYWENGTVPWFRMEDIRENGRILSDALQKVTLQAVKNKPFSADSIIVSTSATIGEHALINVDFMCNQRFTCLTLKKEYQNQLSIMFLFYYCFKLDEYCMNNLKKGNFSSVDMAKFNQFKIPLPPIEEQERIVKILDRFDKLCNDLTSGIPAEISARQKQYEYYRDKLLSFEIK